MQQRQTAATYLTAAEQAYYRGDRDAAYQLVRTALLCDPSAVDAWLWLSKLVDDPARQHECLERALQLDPENSAARDGLEKLRVRQLLSTVQAPALREQAPGARQIGAYLVEHKYISAEQLHSALREQRGMKRRNQNVPLGDLLLQKGLISPGALARALVAQVHEKIGQSGKAVPHFLGEYLLAERLITPAQLELVLEEQMRLKLAGQQVALGNLLVHKKCIDRAKLNQILEQQRVEFYSQMSD
jgi:hypothetical protein